MPDPPARPSARATRLGDVLQVVAAWVVAAALTLALAASIPRAVFVFFWGAVLFAAWRLGLAAAVAASVAAVVVVDVFVFPATGDRGVLSPSDLLTLGIFVTAAALVSALAAGRARAQELAEEQAIRLQEQAVELELQADSAQSVATELELTSEQLQATAAEAEAARAQVVGVLESLSDIVATYDRGWHLVYLNPAARAAMPALGTDPASAIGRVLWDVVPLLRGTTFETELRRAVDERRVVEFEAHLPGLGRWVESRVVPGPDGTVTSFMRDTTDRHRALQAERAAADRASRLLAVTTGLSRTRTPEEVADVIFREGLAALGADAGSLALLHPTPEGPELEIVRQHGYPEQLVSAYRRFPLRAGRPLSDALLTRTPRWLSTREAWRRLYPAAAAETEAMGYEGFVAIPVTSGDETLGAFSASFREARDFDAATRTFLATLGEQCGLALARARAYAAEHEAREFTGEIVASVRDGFVAMDRALRFTFVNARAEEMLGRPAAALLGVSMEEAFPGSESPFLRAARRVLDTQAAESVEALSPTLGRWVDARLYPSRGGLTIFFEDVTARRHAREASDFLIEATRVLSASLDHETTLRAVARAAVPRLGDWCAVDIVEDPTHPVWPPRTRRIAIVHDDPAKVAVATELMTRYPTDWSAETGLAAVLRTHAPVFMPEVTDAMVAAGARDEAHLALLRALEFSSIIVVPLVARDLTLGALTLCMGESRRRFGEADLALAQDLARRAAVAVDNARLFGEAERSRHEAEAANRAKSQFLSTMSHELRTPLNAIAGYTELLEMGVRGPVTDEQREDLARIRRGAKVLMSLVNDVLNFARIEAGQVEVRLADVRVDHVLADLEVMVAPQLHARRLDYSLALDADAPAVRADEDRLKQILSNLLTNAVKFTDEGGRIVVGCDVPDGARDTVRIRVHDSGRGIPADKLAVIFEPFVQVDRHLTRDSQQGVGLGLAISAELARAMGGALTVESVVGRGSTFSLLLPRAASVPPDGDGRPAAG